MSTPSSFQRSSSPHRSLRVGESVARDLRERILAGDYGDELPKQETLIEEFQVSAPSVREAFRVLEAEGLIAVRRGKVGGAVVRLPSVEDTARALGLSLQARQTRVADVASALWSMEPIAVRLCAEREDRADVVLPQLAASIERLEAITDGDDWEYKAQEFHDLMAELCGNQAVTAVLSSLYAIYHAHLDEYLETHGGGYLESAEGKAEVIREHRQMLARIERGQADAAAKLASTHLMHLLSPLLDADEIVSVTIPRSSGSRRRRATAGR